MESEAKTGVRHFYLAEKRGGRVSEEGRRGGAHQSWEGVAGKGGL